MRGGKIAIFSLVGVIHTVSTGLYWVTLDLSDSFQVGIGAFLAVVAAGFFPANIYFSKRMIAGLEMLPDHEHVRMWTHNIFGVERHTDIPISSITPLEKLNQSETGKQWAFSINGESGYYIMDRKDAIFTDLLAAERVFPDLCKWQGISKVATDLPK